MESSAEDAKGRSRLIVPIFILGGLLAAGGYAWFKMRSDHGGRVGYELSAVSTLQHLCEIQDYFRHSDADGNGIKDYWRQDVAGLYTAPDQKGPLKLIEPSLAGADHEPKAALTPYLPRASKACYWYRALHFPDEKNPDPNRFAFCALPDGTSERARKTFIVAHDKVIYFKVLEKPESLGVYPADPVREGWSRR